MPMTTLDTPAAPEGAGSGPLADRLLDPRSPAGEAELAPFNAAHVHAPLAAVAARSAEEVRTAVQYAADHGLTVSVQATGHGASAPYVEGLLISTRQMTGVEVDPRTRTARVEAGAKWRAVIDAAAAHGLAALSGSTSDVGVVGYTLGGGLPVLGRAFGFSADHVRSLEVVTADGRLRHVDAEHEPDLFWGLRGGKGNLGIVTALTVDLFPLRSLYGGGIWFAEEHIPTIFDGFRAWTPTLPDHCCTSVAAMRLPPFPDIPEPLRGRTLAHLRVAHVGPAEEGEELLRPMRALAPAVADLVAEMPCTAIDSIHQDPDHPVPFHERSTLLRELTGDTLDALLAEVGPGVGSPLLAAELRHLGGALGRPPEVPNAVSGRDAAYSLFAVAVLAGPGAETGPAAADRLMAVAAPWSTGQTVLNLHGCPGDEADRARAWDPGTYQRLRALRERYDPAGLIRAGHVIGIEEAER
jgi:FAD/FMN-containing dehydrogenase